MGSVVARTTVGALAALLAGVAWSQASAPAGTLSKADRGFLEAAAHAGLVEVEAGKLAVTKGVNTQVKGFAQQMVDEHGRSNQALAELARAKGVSLPDEPTVAQRVKVDLLSSADGGSFDRRYANSMAVKAHQEALQLFQKASTRADDPDIRAFAAKAVPILAHHLEMAKELKSVVDKEGNAKAPGNRKQ